MICAFPALSPEKGPKSVARRKAREPACALVERARKIGAFSHARSHHSGCACSSSALFAVRNSPTACLHKFCPAALRKLRNKGRRRPTRPEQACEKRSLSCLFSGGHRSTPEFPPCGWFWVPFAIKRYASALGPQKVRICLCSSKAFRCFLRKKQPGNPDNLLPLSCNPYCGLSWPGENLVNLS